LRETYQRHSFPINESIRIRVVVLVTRDGHFGLIVKRWFMMT
jgi:hypothetical protein